MECFYVSIEFLIEKLRGLRICVLACKEVEYSGVIEKPTCLKQLSHTARRFDISQRIHIHLRNIYSFLLECLYPGFC